MRLLALLALSAGLLLAGVANAQDVKVGAAASLANVLETLGKAWAQSGGGRIVGNYAASSALARQIEQGAPIDLFLSADLEWMDYLGQKGLIETATRTTIAANTLVLIAPFDKAATIVLSNGMDLRTRLGSGRLAVADPGSVPAGKYAREALIALGLWSQISSSLAPAENVRAALALVARGETPLGIVYGSDATVEPKVKVVAVFPADSHRPIVYPAAIVKGRSTPAATSFLQFLQTDAARDILREAGFTTGG